MATTTRAQIASIPDGELSIAYRQLQNGQLSQAVFQDHLRCFKGRCALVTLTLNQCFGDKFFPKIQEWSTDGKGWDGGLLLRLVAPDVILAEHIIQGARFQKRFTFTLTKLPTTGEPWFGDVKNFSGGVVKDSDILDKVITWELVPLKFHESDAVKLDCPSVLLDGLPPALSDYTTTGSPASAPSTGRGR
jgi:hypothetical protein